MRVAAGILCWNQDTNGRVDGFERCYESLKGQVDQLVVADNGSTDGTTERVGAMAEGVLFPRLAGFPHGNTCGYGMNKLAATLNTVDADVVILSNDDIVWQPDAVERLREIWDGLDGSVNGTSWRGWAIISGLLEPVYALPDQDPWNTVYGRNGDLWERKSCPGGAWTYPSARYGDIFPVSTFPGVDDVPACYRLGNAGWKVGAVDLAEHVGAENSTWGNGSERFLVHTIEAMETDWPLLLA